MIHEVWLCTNRNILVFDENGEQVPELQKVLSWDSLKSWNDKMTEEALTQVIEAKPIIHITQYGKWYHPINLDEFCCLLGKGEWYWEYKRSKSEVL